MGQANYKDLHSLNIGGRPADVVQELKLDGYLSGDRVAGAPKAAPWLLLSAQSLPCWRRGHARSLHELCYNGARTVWCLAGVLQELREDGALTGWRSESYPVLTSFHSEPLALVERAAAVHLGIKAYGVHVNGFVRGPSGIELWVATRSKDKPTWPGRLDHIVAGGQVHLQHFFGTLLLGILTSGRHKLLQRSDAALPTLASPMLVYPS